MSKNVFKPTQTKNRMLLAAQEGMVMKKLVGALRALWRSSGRGSDERIHELKSYLLPSPSAPDSDADGNDGDRADLESGDSSSDDGDDEKGGAVVTHSPNSPEPLEDVISDHESQESVDSVDAPTLALGEPDATQPDPTPPDSDSESGDVEVLTPSSQRRDSQVSSGWLGRAYMYENAKAREEAEKRRVADGIARTVRSIKSDLETSLKQDLDGELWYSYEKWCSKALQDYGDHVYGHLASPDTFLHWVRDQKAEDWS